MTERQYLTEKSADVRARLVMGATSGEHLQALWNELDAITRQLATLTQAGF